jgi:ABC-type branched-subunit amino acid transport system substrate-binding protein
MRSMLRGALVQVGGLASVGCLLSCNTVLGLNKLSISSAVGSDAAVVTSVGCTTNVECTEQATLAAANDPANADAGSGSTKVPAICLQPDGHCVTLTSEDCTTVTGDYENDKAIVIGSLFATIGTTATQNVPRQQSAMLAIEEINAAGGIPTSTAGSARPLVMVSCNTSVDLSRAANHLVNDIKVPAIVGPNTSQDTLDVSNNVTIKAGVVVMSPSAVAASISDLIDNDLTWLMIPSDNQRAQLMIKNINDLEGTLKAQRGLTNIKLSIIYRSDALGVGTQTSMNSLTINGAHLADPVNAGSPAGNVHIDPYDVKATDYSPILTKELAFAPDIVVLAGTAESVTKVLTPLEQGWTAGANRPYYYLIDPSKGPELLAAVAGNSDLRSRVRGTGTKPGADSVTVASTFSIDYMTRYGSSPTASGTGPSYDAAYAIAYALAATKDLPVTGANIATGLRKLAGGSETIATGTQNLLAAFQDLASGQNINGVGTYCPLDWDDNGSVKGGTIEMWCIGTSGATTVFQSSGLTFDIKTQAYAGSYVQCM